jgi:hypothetical protein
MASTAPSTALVPLSTPTSTPETTPVSTPLSAQERTPSSTQGSTLELAPGQPEPAEIHVLYDADTVVDVSRTPVRTMHPEMHAIKLLGQLIEDGFAGQPATEKAIRKFYLTACRDNHLRPFPGLVVLRRFNVLLKRTYGQDYRKTYRNVYEGGRLRKRRVYRVPTAAEVERAFADPDATVVELAEEKRRRA